MEKIVGLKELRQDMEKYVRATQRGISLVVVRRSKPIFKITPLEEQGGEFTPTATQKKALLRAEKNLKTKKTLSYNELVRKLGFAR